MYHIVNLLTCFGYCVCVCVCARVRAYVRVIGWLSVLSCLNFLTVVGNYVPTMVTFQTL